MQQCSSRNRTRVVSTRFTLQIRRGEVVTVDTLLDAKVAPLIKLARQLFPGSGTLF